jgi:amidohydrolase
MTMTKDTIRPDIDKLEADLVALRRDLHRHPELGHKEDRTSSLVAQRMTALGLDVRTGVGGTGVLADLAGSEPGATLLIRADMDALPVTETTGHDFASETPGVMHACGHDAHVSALVGAATLLTEAREELAGRIRFCFQPAEELLDGASAMISDGAMDGVDRVLGAHVFSIAPYGTVVSMAGPMLAGADAFELRIVGKAGHGGMPQLSVDPIYAAAQVVTALQSIVARETSPGETLVVSIAAIEGGRTFNVVVDEVTLRGTVRWFSTAERERALARIPVIAQGVCEALRAHAEFTVIGSVPVTANVAEHIDVLEAAVAETGRAVAINPGPITGSEDFSRFLERAPGAFFGVGAGGPEAAPHHHHAFDIDERAIALTAEVFVRTARRTLAPLR